MTVEVSSNKSIVWAVDPYTDPSFIERASHLIKLFNNTLSAEVEAVFVLAPNHPNINQSLFPNALSLFKEAETALRSVTKNYEIGNVRPPVVLMQNEGSMRRVVETFLDFCEKGNIDIIVVSSHAATGIPRFFLGSFAETLLLQSKIPVLVTNPHLMIPQQVKHIVFPTDFSETNFEGLQGAIDIARLFDAQLTLFHKNEIPIYLTGQDSPYFQVYFEEEKKQRESTAENWLNRALRSGLKCNIELSEDVFSGRVGKSIVDYATKVKADLIYIVTNSSNLRATFIGSTARYVVRHAECPICVQHG